MWRTKFYNRIWHNKVGNIPDRQRFSRSIKIFVLAVLGILVNAGIAGDGVPRSGPLSNLQETQLNKLRDILNSPVPDDQWGEAVLKTYFDSLYNPSFVDLVVFINSDGDIRLGMFNENERTNDLRGAKDVWVLILSEKVLATKTLVKEDTSKISYIALDTLQTRFNVIDTSKTVLKIMGTLYTKPDSTDSGEVNSIPAKLIEVARVTEAKPKEPDPFFEIKLEVLDAVKGKGEIPLGGLVRAVGKVLGFSADKEKLSTGIKDTILTVDLKSIRVEGDTGHQHSGPDLYVGRLKFPLFGSTLNRISIHPKHPEEIKNTRSIEYTFTNSEASRIGASIGLGGTFDFRSLNFEFNADSGKFLEVRQPDSVDFLVTPYIFGHLYLKRPKSNLRTLTVVDKISLSLFLGTNLIKEDFFEHVAFGLAVGNIVGAVGFVLGGNWIATEHVNSSKQKVTKTRDTFWFIGLDYKL
ncbi:MAG: hypothetical protein A2142_00370 [candidate division Zixibacteria bacterium RBG_16_48_11]|nr:MAG: hypothetical protein A2142_00370 [candidate division Zixibacteria bacterium RBG_16_48_11]